MDFLAHPIFVHFPIALFITGGFIYLIAPFRDRDFFLKMGFFLHLMGLLGSAASILSGRSAEAEVIHTSQIHELLVLHERLAYLATWLFGMLAIWMYLRQKRIAKIELIAFLLLFWGSNATLGYLSHLGGEMVYQEGAGVLPMEDDLKEQFQQEQKQNADLNP